MVNDWSTFFSLIIEKHAFLKEMRVPGNYCSWIDKDLKGLMITLDRLKQAALKQNHLFSYVYIHRLARNKVNALNFQLKKQYFSTKISECEGNMKNLGNQSRTF